jgi:hypothetical protein
MRLRLPPMMFDAAFGIDSSDDASPSEEDEDEDTASNEPDVPGEEADDLEDEE